MPLRRSLHLGVPWGIRDIIVGGPVEGAPHLPRVMQNVTVDEALDSVARTFKRHRDVRRLHATGRQRPV